MQAQGRRRCIYGCENCRHSSHWASGAGQALAFYDGGVEAPGGGVRGGGGHGIEAIGLREQMPRLPTLNEVPVAAVNERGEVIAGGTRSGWL